MEEAFHTYGQNASAGARFWRFIEAIDLYLWLCLLERRVNTLDAALQFALQIENAYNGSGMSLSHGHLTPTHLPVPTPSLSAQYPHSEELRKIQRML